MAFFRSSEIQVYTRSLIFCSLRRSSASTLLSASAVAISVGYESQILNHYTFQGKESSLTAKYQSLKKRLIEIVTKHPSHGCRRIQLELRKGKNPVIINHKPLKKLLKLWGLSALRKIKGRKKSGIEKILEFLGEKANLVKRLKGEVNLFPT